MFLYQKQLIRRPLPPTLLPKNGIYANQKSARKRKRMTPTRHHSSSLLLYHFPHGFVYTLRTISAGLEHCLNFMIYSLCPTKGPCSQAGMPICKG